MKNLILIFLVCFSFQVKSNDDPQVVIEEMISEISVVQRTFYLKKQDIYKKINLIDKKLVSGRMRTKAKVNQLILKDQLRTEINNLQAESYVMVSKIRYIKGLQIIRILYEKILSLDHHFTTVSTFSEIAKIANPQSYPEFDEVNRLIQSNTDKKNSFDLTQLLGTNTMVSVVNTVSNLFVSSLTKPQKEEELKKIECIMDFTTRMQNDLNTIYFETAFLTSANDIIKSDIETLFKEYSKPIGYTKDLPYYRNNDESSQLRNLLEKYLAEMTNSDNAKIRKMQINMEFPIDRLIQFIGQYNSFINDGERFYKKFGIILNSYESETHCESKIPPAFNKLKTDINSTIEKFNIAYKPIEVNGSKMKEILYGLNEYD